VDIGGGTTKLALCRDGEVVDTAVINVGGRLVAHEAGRITRLEDAVAAIGEAVGRRFTVGGAGGPDDFQAVAETMTDCLFEVMERRPLSPLARSLMHTAPLADPGPVATLMFSGGVAEYIYQHEPTDFGDLGRRLGEAIRRRLAARPLGARLAAPTEAIRATVIGAAQYTVQVSGSTVFHPRAGVLPLRNVPVFPVHITPPLSAEAVADAVRRALDGYDDAGGDGPLALAIHWPFGPGYGELRALGEGVVAGLGPRSGATVLAFDRDIARLVGHLMVEELRVSRDLVAVDELELGTFDYVDVGEPLPVSGVIPVVIKSLVFRPAVP
jgi:ethanolamine utilization protein EutA